jgi:hypothetical protein
MVVVLAMEGRDLKAHETANKLINDYSPHFKLIL